MRCYACGGQVKVTPDIDLDKGSHIFGSGKRIQQAQQSDP